MLNDEVAVLCDKVKFSFARIGKEETERLWERIRKETAAEAVTEGIGRHNVELALAQARGSVYHSGRKGTHTVSIYSYELTGVQAELVFQFLPPWSFAYVRTVHAKCYYASLDAAAYLELKSRATDTPMFRQITVFSPQKFRKDGGPVGRLPGMRIGHAQSDVQTVLYKRGGTPFSLEARLNGDVLSRHVKELRGMFKDTGDDVRYLPTALLYTVMGEGYRYLNRLKEQCAMSEVAITGELMTYEELSKVWGRADYEAMVGRVAAYDNHGFPLSPVVLFDEPVRGNVDAVTGEALVFTATIDDTGVGE